MNSNEFEDQTTADIPGNESSPALEEAVEGSSVDIRIDHLTDWADEFFSRSLL
jgi:hypothetical protein